MKYAILRWLMPIGATVLFYKAVAQSDIIMGFIAFGILRSWWKDLMNLHDPKKGVILSRIGRWALLGGIAVQLLVATKIEEYVACTILFIFVWLWKLGKLPGIWQGIRESFHNVKKIEWPKFQDELGDVEEPMEEKHIDEPKPFPVNVATSNRKTEAKELAPHPNEVRQQPEASDPSMEEYKTDAEKALAAFAKREAEVRALQEALMARLEKLEGGR